MTVVGALLGALGGACVVLALLGAGERDSRQERRRGMADSPHQRYRR
jgi:hypothetical protein